MSENKKNCVIIDETFSEHGKAGRHVFRHSLFWNSSGMCHFIFRRQVPVPASQMYCRYCQLYAISGTEKAYGGAYYTVSEVISMPVNDATRNTTAYFKNEHFKFSCTAKAHFDRRTKGIRILAKQAESKAFTYAGDRN